jgi:hypothetical protein
MSFEPNGMGALDWRSILRCGFNNSAKFPA